LPEVIHAERKDKESEEQQPAEQGQTNDIWGSLIKQLEELSPDAAEWDYADEFILALKELAAHKIESRQTHHIRVEQLIQESKDQARKVINYLEFTEVDKWDPAKLISDEALLLVDLLEKFKQQLLAFQELKNKFELATVSEENVLRPEFENMKVVLQDTYSGLRVRFGKEGETSITKLEPSYVIPAKEPIPDRENEFKEQIDKTTEPGFPELLSKGDPIHPQLREPDLYAEGITGDSPVEVKPEPGAEEPYAPETSNPPTPEPAPAALELSPPETLGDGPVKPEVYIEPGEAETKEIEVPPAPTIIEYDPVSPEEAEQSLFVAMDAGNLPLAYWLALGLEQAWEPAVPSWLLAGVQGAHWFMTQWPDIPQTLLDEIHQEVEPKNRTIKSEQSILALSIALGMGLFDNGAGWEDWLSVEIPSSAANLNALLIEADQFIQSGIKLQPVIVQHVLGKEQVEARTRELARQAKIWLEQAPQKGTRFPGADDVWKKIVGSRGTIHIWFDYVAQDDRKNAEKVQKELETWSDRPWLDNHIQKLHRERRGGAKTIDGGARDQLIHWLIKATEIAAQWSDLIIESNIEVGKRHWMWEQTSQFCDFLKKNLPGSVREACNLQQKAGSQLERISYAVLEESLHLLALGMNINTGTGTRIAESFLPSHTLQENLASVLIYYPELALKENGCPRGILGKREVDILVRAKHSERDAFDLWLNHHNYTFLNTLINRMPKSVQDEARQSMDERWIDDIQLVEHEIEKTTVAIEQALLDDLVAEQDYVTAKGNVESIRKQLKLISSAGSQSEAVDFRSYLDKLHEIQKKFEVSHDERLSNYKKHWEKLLLRLPKFIPQEEDRQKIIRLVEDSLEQKDLRAVGETIAHLDDVATGNEKLVLDLFSGKTVTYRSKEFHAEMIPMIRTLDTEAIQDEGRKFSRNLPVERRREVQKALEAWVSLKREENRNLREENFSLLTTILQYLGWDMDSNSPISVIPHPSAGFQHWRVLATPRIPSPVPQFGSERFKETTGRFGLYDVVGAWGRPGFDAIEALINQVGKKPFIMLYFGRMQPNQRLELMRLARRKQHPLIVVDELLMLFLSREYDVRISAMFDCALPYSSVNPYAPFATGSVPPEMYFGREDKMADVENPYGPSIVYGGRQLGKSALLRQVQRNFHHPERGQFAIYEDIRLIGDPMSEKDYRIEIAERLINALRQGSVLEPSKQSFDITKLADILIHQIKSKGWRVLLLIDEADMFLEADAGRKFTVVTTLKRVMDQTDRMFKVVFAGLNHVQKFTKTSNQPLAHLGDSSAINVGPLEPLSAIELIEKPLRSLGYVFGKPGHEDPSLIAHILSYSNYHPGLLQLFGQFLVDHLNQKSYGNLHPPYAITRSDIEAVYRITKVRETIRNRFNITLELDERYEAITLSLILEQWDEKNGFDRLFSPEDLLKIARGYWIAGFSEDITVFKGFLEEMCGLGVLSSVSLEDENIKYRLRSPNLVSLMGNYDEIFNRLEVISQSQPVSQQRKLESYHAPVNSYYSPLTYAQERVIIGNTSGVAMVFGTQATHIHNLAETLEKTVRAIGDWYEIKVSARTEATMREHLKGLIKRSQKPIIAYRELDGTGEEMVEQIKAAAHFCRQTHDKKLRVVFALDAISAWKWFQIPTKLRLEVEQNYVDVSTALARWDRLGIRQMLEQHEPEIPAGDANIKRIDEVTGGWPNLMDKFIDLCRGVTDPLPALDELKKCLSTEVEKKDFTADLGLYDDKRIKIFLDKVLQEKDLKSLSAEEGIDYLFGEENLEESKAVLEYLRRLSIVQTTPHLRVEPVVARALHEQDR
jgi:hypothetical protein